MRYAFDSLIIDAATRELSASGVPVQVEPKVLDLVLHLIQKRDRVLSKDELVDAVWQGRIISDAAIASAVSAARRALGDNGREQRYIRTVHARGFRFVGHVVEFATSTPAPQTEASDHSERLAEEGFPFSPELLPGVRSMALQSGSPSAGMSFADIQMHWPRVAVLPLRCPDDDKVASEIADAVTEDLVIYLSRDRSLSIIATHNESISSHGLFSGLGQPAGSIGARYLIDGSVRQLRGSLIITLRLVDVYDGRHLWLERCALDANGQSPLDDRFSAKLAAGLRNEIESNERMRAEAATELDFHAAYLKGSRELYRFTYQGLVNARSFFAKAIQQNPNSASAHARLAYVDIQLYWYGAPESRQAALKEAIRGATHAASLDPKNALGRMSLGRARALDRKLDDAIPELEVAVALDPCLAQLHFALGRTLCYAGSAGEAIRRLDAAIDLNPYDPHHWAFLHDRSEAHFALGRLADAERDARAAARAPNATHWPWVTLAAVQALANNTDGAQEALRVLSSRRPDYALSTARKDLSHYSDSSFVDLYVEGLRRAGLR